MSKLYEITDAYAPEETIDSLPVEQPVLPTERPRVIINTAEFDKPKPDPLWDKVKSGVSGIGDAIKYASELDQKFTSNILNLPKKAYENSDDLVKGIKNLFGLGEEERYQLWPEKVVREALTSAGDIAKPNPYPEGSEQWQFYENKRQEGMVPAAMAISALAGSGGLAGTGAKAGEVALGATPFLRPALKHKDRLYKGKPGQEHQDIIPKELYEDFRQKAMSGEDLAEYNFGFINDKGHFLDREKALKYGIDTGIIDPHAGKFGALTSTLMADSSRPGVAIEAMAKTANPFYSAVEHTVKNIPQAKMTGDQWLGTLSNKPGVKPEELDWIGLKGFLEENKGKPVTKQQIEEHIAANKVELKEVTKGTGELKKAAEDLQAAVGNDKISIANHRDKLYADEIEQGLWSGDIAVKDLPTNLQPHAEKMLSLRHQQENPTKYHSYQLPGGENYKELLLTLPTKDAVFDQNLMYYMRKYPQVTSEIKTIEDVALAQKHNPAFRETSKGLSPEEVLATARASEKPTKEAYKSSHWDEPNILAHVRMNDRYFDGKKSLHLEEIQSDWHQQGRDKGYKSGEDIHDLVKKETSALEQAWLKASDNKYKNYSEAMKANESGPSFLEMQKKAAADPEVASIRQRIDDARDGVPDAPFKKSWHELALKRMIREAAEKGYDRLSWTPGEAQAARYDLSKQLKELQYLKNDDGTYSIAGVTKDGGGFNHPENVTADKLPNIVGKEMAEKIIKNEGKRARGHPANGGYFEGVDLKIGGEGMKGFYDQIIPKSVNKIAKEYGVKVEKGKTSEGHDIFYIDLPEGLKNTALRKGFPLFSNVHPGYSFIPYAGNPFENEK